jgi:hypothetical protein
MGRKRGKRNSPPSPVHVIRRAHPNLPQAMHAIMHFLNQKDVCSQKIEDEKKEKEKKENRGIHEGQYVFNEGFSSGSVGLVPAGHES